MTAGAGLPSALQSSSTLLPRLFSSVLGGLENTGGEVPGAGAGAEGDTRDTLDTAKPVNKGKVRTQGDLRM